METARRPRKGFAPKINAGGKTFQEKFAAKHQNPTGEGWKTQSIWTSYSAYLGLSLEGSSSESETRSLFVLFDFLGRNIPLMERIGIDLFNIWWVTSLDRRPIALTSGIPLNVVLAIEIICRVGAAIKFVSDYSWRQLSMLMRKQMKKLQSPTSPTAPIKFNLGFPHLIHIISIKASPFITRASIAGNIYP